MLKPLVDKLKRALARCVLSVVGWKRNATSRNKQRRGQGRRTRQTTKDARFNPNVLDFTQVGADDVALVGGKCSSLGEMFLELTGPGRAGPSMVLRLLVHAYELLLDTGGLGNG